MANHSGILTTRTFKVQAASSTLESAALAVLVERGDVALVSEIYRNAEKEFY